jgi:hypothetical protein
VTGRDVRPGDLVEIATPEGFAYLHVLHRPASYPPVVRLLPGRHARRPDAPEAVLAAPGGSVLMVPLAEVLDRLGLGAEVVARTPVAERPRFRMAVRDRTGRVLYWWFWDGDTLSFSDDPKDTETALPLREITGADRFRAVLDETASGASASSNL